MDSEALVEERPIPALDGTLVQGCTAFGGPVMNLVHRQQELKGMAFLAAAEFTAVIDDQALLPRMVASPLEVLARPSHRIDRSVYFGDSATFRSWQ
jgi:hypothetical protein